MDEVAASGEEIVVTKNGKPVSRLVPIKTRTKELFGFHKEDWHQIDLGEIGAKGSFIKR